MTTPTTPTTTPTHLSANARTILPLDAPTTQQLPTVVDLAEPDAVDNTPQVCLHRAMLAAVALREYARVTGVLAANEATSTVLGDLLVDLRHLFDALQAAQQAAPDGGPEPDLEFYVALESSYRHYLDEINGVL